MRLLIAIAIVAVLVAWLKFKQKPSMAQVAADNDIEGENDYFFHMGQLMMRDNQETV